MSPFLELFGDRSKFCKQIEHLMSSIDRINNDSSVKEQLDRLRVSIESCIKECGRIYIFGSRMYGIAQDNSDVDFYFDPGDCFSGKIAGDRSRQLQLIDLFIRALENNKEFIGLEVLTTTRVPIVRFFHNTTNFKCDVQFRSGLAVRNSELIKLYLSMDERVRWVVSAVKHWAVTFDLIGDDFSTFSVIWLVLFIMMQYKIVPPIIDLWEKCHNFEPNHIEDWDTSVCFNNDHLMSNMTSKSKNHTKWELLRFVFEFYSDPNKLQNYVLCTFFGELLPKKKFYSNFITKFSTIDYNYKFQINTFEKCKVLVNNNFGNPKRIELQNPLKLCNNVTAWLNNKNMELFIDLCIKSAKSM
ncbi:Hypothetical protein CINCED_3A016879 [Cinara cedri]|uniref:Poly(A) RNA polymerase mitochondrial-like central palm domain-containing protein n=1 Tax=Cinara cedri TaxID=506608 RepID=A0A5E4MX96_9HEMI|nr:Hypothetical protein CINCED_3A016879 [Cinara cedri]